MSHVFISYVRQNKEIVDRLYEDLMANDIRVWIDRNEIDPGSFWKKSIRKAISQGNFFVACFSAEYNERSRTYMHEELNIAIEELRLRPIDRSWFIPVLFSGKIPDIDISGSNTLKDLQYVELSDEDWDVGIERIIRVIKPEKTEMAQRVHRLISFLSSSYPADRKFAAEALRATGNYSKEAMPFLIELLEDVSDPVRVSAIETIALLSAYAEDVVPKLIKQFKTKDYNPVICNATVEALGKIGKAAIPYIEESLQDDNFLVRMYAVRFLKLIAARFKDVVPFLIKMTSDEAYEVRISAVQSLGDIEVDPETVIPTLLDSLKDNSSSIRKMSADVLASFGPSAKESVGQLTEGLKDETPFVRYACANALGRIGEGYSDAVPILEKLLTEDHEFIRKAASFALEKIDKK